MLGEADDIFGTRLAEYKEMRQAICEMQRFYQAYEAGEKIFMFRSDYEIETEKEKKYRKEKKNENCIL